MLSFIVPAYNEEFELARSIGAIRSAVSGASLPYEIIVVDDGSTDATPRIAEAEAATLVQIQRRQIAAARNAGARAARGEILFFIDADTRISKAHVTDALVALDAGCSGGSARVLVDGVIPVWARIFVSIFSTLYFANRLGAGAFLFTTRKNYEQVGGFDEELFIGEEVYFSLALKKLGRFKLLPVPILTSGRKLRMYSAGHILSRSFWIIVRGKRAAKSRNRLELWYRGKTRIRLNMTSERIAIARSPEEIRRCYPVMHELRTDLVNEQEFLERVQRQQHEGYILAFLETDDEVRAVAGYRYLESLFSGKFLYVDDLVTGAADRSRGFGARLLDWLIEEARAGNCDQLELDSGVQRFDAHRFYFARRMKIASYHFSIKTKADV